MIIRTITFAYTKDNFRRASAPGPPATGTGSDSRSRHNDQLSQPCPISSTHDSNPNSLSFHGLGFFSIWSIPSRHPRRPGLWVIPCLCLQNLQLSKISNHIFCCKTCMYLIDLDTQVDGSLCSNNIIHPTGNTSSDYYTYIFY